MNRENLKEKMSGRRKRAVMLAVFLLIAGVAAAIICLNMITGDEAVSFEEIKEKDMPNEITSEIIPEYRDLERALACVIDDDVYVIVTRGEKPTSGFKVSVDRMILENKDDKSNLVVYANFKDPDKKTALSQIITYPVQVVKTSLKTLPDTIELRIQY